MSLLSQSILDQSNSQSSKSQVYEPLLASNSIGPQLINGSGFISHLVFKWSFNLIKNSQKKTIKPNQVPILTQQQDSLTAFRQFQKNWKEIGVKRTGRKLLFTIMFTHKRQIANLLALSVAMYILYLAYPILIYFDIDYVQNSQEDLNKGIILFLLTTVGFLLYSVVAIHQQYYQRYLGANLVSTMNLMIFNKALKYPILSSRQFREADIINYSQIDVENLTHFPTRLAFFLFGIVEIIAGLALLYAFIGVLFLIPLGVMFVINCISYLIGKKTIDYNMQILEKKDDRMKATQEMLNIIKFIKVNAYQKYFYSRICKERKIQLHLLKKKGLIESLMNFLYYLTAPIILSIIFLAQVYLKQEITAATIFVTMTIIHIFQWTAHSLPKSISELISVFNSLHRIETFLLAEELQTNNYDCNEQAEEEDAVVIKNGNFYSEAVLNDVENDEGDDKNNKREEKEKSHTQAKGETQSVLLLKDVDLNIKRGKFYMVFGDVGCGKSTLLLSILNEMRKGKDTAVRVRGRIAYVSQRPWVFCDSLRNNVTFAFPNDAPRLRQAFEAACLADDIAVLPDGESTAIGENGVNLSGGQKARVGLGRALFSEADVVLLDDVLSAVDVHVAERILRAAVRGVLRGKTVLMATHAARFPHLADRILLLKEGRIIAEENYQNISKRSDFEQIQTKIKQHQNEEVSSSREDLQRETSTQNVETEKGCKQAENKMIIEEESEIGSLKLAIFKKFIKESGGYSWFLIAIVGSFAAYSSLQTLAAFFIEQWSQSIGTDQESLYLYVGLALSSILFIFIEVYSLLISNVRQGKWLHNTIIKRILYSSYTEFFNRVPVGRILNRLGKDIKDLDEAIGLSLSYCLLFVGQFVSGLVLVVYCSSAYVLIPTAIICVIFYFIRKYYVTCLHQVIRLEKRANSPVVSGFTTAVSGLPTIRAYKQQKAFLERQANNINQYKKMVLNKEGLESWFQLTLNYLTFVLNVICIGIGMFSKGTTSSSFGLLLISVININELIYYLFLEYTNLEANMICVERLYEFAELPVEEAYQRYCGDAWDEEEEAEDPQTQGKSVLPYGALEFREAAVRYRADLPDILRGVSVAIRAGERVGIVGRTGSGKSTLINALLRLAPLSAGSILLDGLQIRDADVKRLRRAVTVVEQEPILVEGTFRDNLDLLRKHSDGELETVLRECGLWATITARGGLGGRVERNGLSAGEKQLLCVCRALLRDSRLVLIDEATANVDARNDATVQRMLAERLKGRTVLTIAHRVETLHGYDKIMVMEAGRVAEFGTPESLLEQKGLFYRMKAETHNKKKK